MTETFPTTQLVDAQNLTGDAYIELFDIQVTSGAHIYITAGAPRTWKSISYEFIPIKIDAVDRTAGSDLSRPKATLANPSGIFSSLVGQGVIDNATVTRYRFLATDADAGTNYTKQIWKVRRVIAVTKDVVQLELRDQFDGQFFLSPGRMFIPPEFKQVKLQ